MLEQYILRTISMELIISKILFVRLSGSIYVANGIFWTKASLA